MLRFLAAISLLSLGLSTTGLAQQPSTTPQVDINPTPNPATTYTVPGTGGYVWGSGQNTLAPPTSTGGSVGVQYPPQTPTQTYCNGRPC
jgi:hypothetical protein